MNSNQFRNELERIAGAAHLRFDEPMRLHTTFKIGGPADIFVIPENESVFSEAVKLCTANNVPFYVIGNGSNLLVSDKGIRGVVFQIYRTLDKVVFSDNGDGTVTVTAGAGIMLSNLAKMIAEEGLCGFEFASGIPGTFGGAMTMNAGAYGGEMSQCAFSAVVMDRNGCLMTLKKEELDLGYRTSIIQKKDYIVLSASLIFKKGDKTEIFEKMNELNAQRRSKQPLEYPSAGSTFKRPEGYFAGKLIHDAGLRGFCVGDACVSEKHSGFVINKGGATAGDVLGLIKEIQERVMEKFGVSLEMEIKMLGDFDE